MKTYTYNTKFSDAAKLLRKYDDKIEKIVEDIRQYLTSFAGIKGPIINPSTLADEADTRMVEVFEKENQ